VFEVVTSGANVEKWPFNWQPCRLDRY